MKAVRVLTEDLTDRQLVIGIQIGSLVCTCEAAILLKASAIIRKRIALLSACRR